MTTTGPTLADDLEGAAKVCESVARYPNGIWNADANDALAARLRAAATRLREWMRYWQPGVQRTAKDHLFQDKCLNLLERINGGPANTGSGE